jgi:hypothetical protein
VSGWLISTNVYFSSVNFNRRSVFSTKAAFGSFTNTFSVAARSKVYVCGRFFAGFAGSNHDGGMGICLLWVLCVVRWSSLRRADHLSRGVLTSVFCLSVIGCKNNTSHLMCIGRRVQTGKERKFSEYFSINFSHTSKVITLYGKYMSQFLNPSWKFCSMPNVIGTIKKCVTGVY